MLTTADNALATTSALSQRPGTVVADACVFTSVTAAIAARSKAVGSARARRAAGAWRRQVSTFEMPMQCAANLAARPRQEPQVRMIHRHVLLHSANEPR